MKFFAFLSLFSFFFFHVGIIEAQSGTAVDSFAVLLSKIDSLEAAMAEMKTTLIEKDIQGSTTTYADFENFGQPNLYRKIIPDFLNLGHADLSVSKNTGNFGGLAGNGDTYSTVYTESSDDAVGFFVMSGDVPVESLSGNNSFQTLRWLEFLMVGTENGTDSKLYLDAYRDLGLQPHDGLIRFGNSNRPVIFTSDGRINATNVPVDLEQRLLRIETDLGY